jgi:amidase
MTPDSALEICFMSARELAESIRRRRISAREVMIAFLRRIERVNPKINAIVAKLDDEKCLELADEADRRLARGENIGPLHGLPFAFKELDPVVGFPMTRGSRIFKDYRPAEDSIVAERVKRAGALAIGKTNISEFGMGSHTYNDVYGTTFNPYDLTKSAGGSSGGAGAALAAGLLPLASGSDLGGSLRNPANFNNIVALRPSVGLVPTAPAAHPFFGISVKGPMARSVEDVALLLSVMAGADPRDPGTHPSNPAVFADSLERDFKNVRVAWCPDLGGLPVDRRVRAVLEEQRKTFCDLGCIVEEACPDLRDADDIFLTLRAWNYWHTLGPLLERHRNQMKPEAVWQIEAGRDLSGAAVAQAFARHGELVQRMRLFQEKYEFLLCCVNQVMPFPADLHWPREIDGITMDNYLSWMKSAYWISATFCPSISVPAGFSADGLPVGIQIVGRYRDDLGVIQFAHAFVRDTRFGAIKPASEIAS